uniref:MANSC domain-containing protein n=2 Tax=Lutzomyia longipalpis TaxID=7200 RepID=A0A1B0CDC5_LUTLO
MSSNNYYIINAMLRAITIILLLEINNITICAYHVDTHSVAKRMMDSELCLGRFDVHTDTIIRTKESLKLKAVFLDETEVLNNQECANLCCDTENCDVFIFEEKVKGTCFLFQCGPPEDFRCKFTRHANYTSAVMSPMRQPEQQTSPPLAHPAVPSVGLSQHEMELVRECLAVYNACDGIPQCEDGSDEGPECPKQPSAGGGQQNSQNGQQMQDLSNTVRLLPSDSGNEGNNAPQMTMQRQYQIHNREDPMTAPKQWPQMNPMFLDGDSRIFNHKGGIQVPASSMSGPGYQMVPPQDAFMRPQMGDMYSRGQIQSQQQSWLPEHYQGKIPGNPMEWNQQPVDQSTMVQQSPALLAPQIPQLPQPPQLTATQVELQQQRPDWPIVPLMPVQPGKNHPNENVKEANKG